MSLQVKKGGRRVRGRDVEIKTEVRMKKPMALKIEGTTSQGMWAASSS